MSKIENGAAIYVPTLRERFWRKLGFRYHLGEEPEDVSGLDGWMMTVSHLRFSWADRFRLLLTGHLKTRTVSFFDAPSPSVVKNRLDWEIKPPGAPR